MESYGPRIKRDNDRWRALFSGLIRGDPRHQRKLRWDQDNDTVTGRKEVKENRIYFFTNGILSDPQNIEGWTDNAERWVEANTPFKSQRYEYRTGALFRRLYQNSRVNQLSLVVSRSNFENMILVGHSNGCDLIERLIKRKRHKFHEVHLIAAASERDFRKNGLNSALIQGRVGKAFIYCSQSDNALKKAKLSTRFFSWMGLGYGHLGLDGPTQIASSVREKVKVIWRDEFDHGDWFSSYNFEETMRTITGSTRT